ncbi:hypothetical protein [Glutamicibacter protophormiae]
MASKPIVSVDGGRMLRATLKAAEHDLSTLQGIHARVASVVEGRARQMAPKVTGTLASTIRSSGTKTAAVVRAGFKRTPYAGPNNWGWPEGAAGIKGSFGGEHWITVAAKQTEPQWLALYLAEVNKAISKVKGI